MTATIHNLRTSKALAREALADKLVDTAIEAIALHLGNTAPRFGDKEIRLALRKRFSELLP